MATITYSDGTVMARLGDTNRTIVPLSKVPVDVRWDVLAAEDRNFYSESGYLDPGHLPGRHTTTSPAGTPRAARASPSSTSRTPTLNDPTAPCQAQAASELAIALKLDREYSKDQILEWYLNTIYFGRGAYGIQAASQAYFGVDVDKLTVNQGAIPGRHDPGAVVPTTRAPRPVSHWPSHGGTTSWTAWSA